ncbi:MAG: hypothetical protein IPQ13_03660 [Holophagaceae bacterium]|nr:hypothetical protein [Holophagaceae bacterium]
MPLSFPFQRGQLVVVVVTAPRQKLWGRILGLETAGIAVRGIDIAPWEDVLALVNRGHADQVALDTRFFPMHRIEQMYLDEASSGVPSLGEVFRERTGLDPMEFLADRGLPRRKNR